MAFNVRTIEGEIRVVDAAGELVLQQKISSDPRRWQPFDPKDETYAPFTHGSTDV